MLNLFAFLALDHVSSRSRSCESKTILSYSSVGGFTKIVDCNGIEVRSSDAIAIAQCSIIAQYIDVSLHEAGLPHIPSCAPIQHNSSLLAHALLYNHSHAMNRNLMQKCPNSKRVGTGVLSGNGFNAAVSR